MKRIEESQVNQKKKTAVLGLFFILLLVFAYTENSTFFSIVGNIFLNPLLAVLLIFMHNVLVVSLILLGMTFYVGLVVNFMQNRKEEYVILQNPRIFSLIFTVIIIFISILRASMLVYGEVMVETMFFVFLLSTPNAVIEGYGIFKTIEKTLKQKMPIKALIWIYLIFLVAAIIEVVYMYLLTNIS